MDFGKILFMHRYTHYLPELFNTYDPRLILEWIAKGPRFFLGDGEDSSDLGHRPFCWFCHALAQIDSDPKRQQNRKTTCAQQTLSSAQVFALFRESLLWTLWYLRTQCFFRD